MNRKNPGAIVIVALMMVSVIVMLTEQLMRSVFVGSRFIKTMMDREKAKTLAISGINVVIAQLLPGDDKDKDSKDNDDKKQDPNNAKAAASKRLLKVLLPNLNRWQTCTFTEKSDGIDATLKICIVSEQGKININETFDFEKQEFKKEYAEFLSKLVMPAKKIAEGEILKALQAFLIKRKKKLHDISELHEIKIFEGLDIFYKPPVEPQNKKEKAEPNQNLALQDIFTIWSGNAEMHPLLLSDALCNMLGLRRPHANDEVTMKEKYKQFLDEYRDDWGSDWDQNWKKVSLIYDNKPSNLKNLQPVLAKQFEPTIYSVLSCGKVGNAEQQLLAVIKKVQEKQDVKQQDVTQANAQQNQKPKENFKIIRVYWL